MAESSGSPSDSISSPAAKPAAGKPTRRRVWGRVILIIVGVLLLIFIGMQFIPIKRTNPSVTTQLKWDSPQTEALARRACMDCHSNETRWPWYTYIAPASWLTYYDVMRGRSQLNLSTYNPASGGRPGEGFGQPSDLAYRLGQILAGENRRGGLGQGEGGGRPFPTRTPGQQPPQNGQFRPGGGEGRAGGRITEVIQNGSMPPAKYTLIHSDAKLSDAERQQLIQGLQATLAQPAQ
jgi:hypothetical protein